MSKDPAFLFYTSDFLTGTMTMSNEQVGIYIRLLCLQHQKGALSEKDMYKICSTHDEDIFEKFEIDENGYYYSVRLKEEIEKRKAYSESRRNNRKNKEDILNTSKTYVQHMENENENEIEDIIENDNLNEIVNIKAKRKIEKIAVAGREYSKQELFDFAWKTYLRKDGKEAARKAWDKLTIEEIFEIGKHLPKYIKANENADRQFIPHFSTYLNQKRFKDEITPSKMDILKQKMEEVAKEMSHLQNNTLQLPENQ
jgi:uncharacterized protein YdaU (DUF1376 family)